jgi:hypothetical protein
MDSQILQTPHGESDLIRKLPVQKWTHNKPYELVDVVCVELEIRYRYFPYDGNRDQNLGAGAEVHCRNDML